MKTIESTAAPANGSQPGNLSVRQLAKSLIQTPAAAKTKEPEKTGAEAETREVPPPENREAPKDLEVEISPEEQTRLEAKASETGKSVEDILAEEDAVRTAETEEQVRLEAKATETGKTIEEVLADERATAENGNEAEATVSEAMAQRIDTELKPLIEELTKAGAKGALQILQKRIPKLVDQRDTERNGRLAAEETAAGLRQELQEARSQKPETTNGGGGNGGLHPEVAQVVTELANVDHWLGWCEQNPEGGELPDGKGGKLELTTPQVKAMRTTLEHERTELVARKVQTERDVKAAYQQEYQKHHTAAVAEYPWLSEKNSPEYQELQGVLKAAPGLKASPDFELMVADFIAGKAVRLARAKAKGNGTAAPRKPAPSREPTRVVAEPPGSSAARKAPEKAKKDEADSQFVKSGRTGDLAKSFAANRRASRTGG